MNQKNSAQVVLITGSSSGLGFELAKKLAALGKKIILTGRCEEKLQHAASKLPAEQVHTFCGDLADADIVNKLIQTLSQQPLWFPEIIIHNLGNKVADDTHPLTLQALHRSIQIGLEPAVSLNAHCLPLMVQKGFGRIIHISSDASLTGQSAPGYATAKAAVNGYVKSTARFYAKHNIMICAVLPGVFEHEGSAWTAKKLTEPHNYQKKIDSMPMGRFGSAQEMADLIADIACSNSMMCAGSLIELRGAF